MTIETMVSVGGLAVNGLALAYGLGKNAAALKQVARMVETLDTRVRDDHAPRISVLESLVR